jgi:hypothetical protein
LRIVDFGLQFPVEVGEGPDRLRAQILCMGLSIMAEDTVEDLQSQVPASSFTFKFVEKAYRLNVMLERCQAIFYAQVGEELFPVMAERGVADIVAKGNSLDKIFIEMQEAADSPGYPGYQLNMQNPVGYMIIGNEGKDLGFVDIPGVGTGVEDPVGIEGELLAIPDFLFR